MTGEPNQPSNPMPEIPFAQPIGYATPIQNARPGLITAIGVISIVLGSLGILTNAFSTLQYVALMTISRVANTVALPPTPPVTATATTPSAASRPGSTAGATPINAAAFVAALDGQSGNVLTPAAKTVLTNILAAPGQTHAPPGTLPAQVSVTPDGTGGATFYFPNGDFVTINGTATATSTSSFSSTTFPAGAVASPFGNPSMTAATLAILIDVIAVGLSILLLVAGIMMIRMNPSGRRLHWWYVWLKIPLCLIGAAAGFWFYVGAFSPTSSNGGNVAMSWGFAFMFIVSIGFSLIYPVALLFALNSRTVKTFYEPVDPARA